MFVQNLCFTKFHLFSVKNIKFRSWCEKQTKKKLLK